MNRAGATPGRAVSPRAGGLAGGGTAPRQPVQVQPAAGGGLDDRAQPAIETLSARSAGENFPVALRALPRRYQRHLMAVYRFARLVDDIGDEQPADAGGRLRVLDAVEQDLDRAFSSGAAPTLPVIAGLVRTAAECAIPAQPFRMLIQANRQDQTVSRYASFDELLGYCRLSANPVGQAVLHVFAAVTPERVRLSDLVCTALQLAEHTQDVAEDFTRDRIYLPQQDMAAFGCTEADLADAVAAARGRAGRVPWTMPQQVRELIRFETERARKLLDEGAALTGTLRGWPRLAVAGYVGGGRATLAAIAAAGYDVFSATRRPGRAATATGLFRAFLTGG